MPHRNLLYYETLDEPVDNWLEKNVVLPKSVTDAPGQLSFGGQPWAREILRTIFDPHATEIDLVFGAQTGKTLLILLAWMAFARFRPAPALIALSTDPLADRVVKNRLRPLLEANPAWGSLLPPPNKGQESMILFPGMSTFYTGARTPSKLASYPAGLLFLDEVAKWESGSSKEAHPFFLVRERVKSFATHKIIAASTPAIPEDAFWSTYTHSSQSHFFMPCPHCRQDFTFEFSETSLRWERSKSIDVIRRTAHYVCPHCQGKIYNHQKNAVMSAGHWVATKEGHESGHFGFHLNSIYSPFVSFGDVAAEFIKAQASTLKTQALRNFTNSWLALPWVEKEKQLTAASIRALISTDATATRGTLPSDFAYLVCGIDPGSNATHFVVAAVVLGESQLPRFVVVDYGTFHSYSSLNGKKGPAWFIQNKRYGEEPISTAFIDSGFGTAEVYDECQLLPPGLLNPTKGSSASVGVYGHAAISNRAGLVLTKYSDNDLKSTLEDLKANGQITLPFDSTEDLIAGLSGQTLIRLPSGRTQWKELREDHFNDCLKLCVLSSWIYVQNITPETD